MTAERKSKKRVLFMPRWYPSRIDPMPGLFIRRHAISVSGYCEVSVLAVHLDFDPFARKYDIEEITNAGIFEINIYTKAAGTGFRIVDSCINLWRLMAAHMKGFRRIKQVSGKPDLIHVNVLTRLGFIAMIYGWLYRIPYVITEHWTRYLPGMDNFKGALRKIITRWVVRNAAAVMPVTANLQRSMEKHGLINSNYRVIPNVVDTGKFNLKQVAVDRSRKMFLHVSCFDDNQKNISGILNVLKRLSFRRQDWICTMTGEGIHFERLVKYASELKLKDKFVYFTGLLEGEPLVDLMQKACFQVMFSRYENLPVVIPESFACGVPFISTDVGGIAEHINPSLGRLIPSEDEDALLETISYMLDHYHEYDKQAIRKYALDHFSNEVIGRQIWQVYTEVMMHKGHKRLK